MTKRRNPKVLAPIGARLRAARVARGWTVEALAEQIGVQAVTITRYEGGQRSPELATLVRLARILGVGLSDLVDGQVVGDGLAPDAREVLGLLAALDDRQRDLALRVLREIARA